jgi:hypothetical protein
MLGDNRCIIVLFVINVFNVITTLQINECHKAVPLRKEEAVSCWFVGSSGSNLVHLAVASGIWQV